MEAGLVAILLIAANVLVSYRGFQSPSYLDAYSFKVDDILVDKDYKRLATSGFLHVSWTHLFFNMMTLYFFSSGLEDSLGALKFLTIYFGSLVGGDLFSLYVHRQHGDYCAVGASGAISGVVFASIALFPGMGISFFGLPFFIPAWLYGFLYVLYSVYGIKSKRDNIGHEAHLGGGLVGLLIAVMLEPNSLLVNYLPILFILIPSGIFIFLIVTRPEFLLTENFFRKKEPHLTIDQQYNMEMRNRDKELNTLLEKIGKTGFVSLTPLEKERLRQLSGERK